MGEELSFGLVGCGGIGVLRAEALKKSGGAKLRLACDKDIGLAQSVSAKFGGENTSDWTELVKREDIDAVIVSTPPNLHQEMCIAALEAGKHVLCEKPLARTPEECRRILGAAKRSGAFIATGFNGRFFPSIVKAREVLDSGLIGELDHIRSYAGYLASEHSQEWFHDESIMGGGALRDNGIHLIDLTRYFLGDVTEITGFSSNGVWHFAGCEDNGFALLRNSDKKIASLHASWSEWLGFRLKIEIYGTRGCIITSCFPMTTRVVWGDTPGGRTKSRSFRFLKTFIFEHLFSYRWVLVESLVREIDAFAQATKGNPSQIASGTDGMRAIEVAHIASGNSSKSAGRIEPDVYDP